MPFNPMATASWRRLISSASNDREMLGAIDQAKQPEGVTTQRAKKKRAALGVIALVLGVVTTVGIGMEIFSPSVNQEKPRARTVVLWLEDGGSGKRLI